MKTCLLPLRIPSLQNFSPTIRITADWAHTPQQRTHTASRTCLSECRWKENKQGTSEKPTRRASGKRTTHIPCKGSCPGVHVWHKPNPNIHPTAEDLWSLAASHTGYLKAHFLCVLEEKSSYNNTLQLQGWGKGGDTWHLWSCPRVQALWLVWAGDLSRHVNIPEWNGTVCGLWDFVLKHHCWCVCSACCSVYGRKWI